MDFSWIQWPKWIHTVKLLIVLVVLLHAMRSVLYQSVHMDTRYCERIELVCDWIQHTQCVLSLSASGSRSHYLSQYSHSCSCNGCRTLIHADGRACLFSKIACRCCMYEPMTYYPFECGECLWACQILYRFVWPLIQWLAHNAKRENSRLFKVERTNRISRTIGALIYSLLQVRTTSL